MTKHTSFKYNVFSVESPSFFRLSEDLKRYGYPDRLGIERVELNPDCEFRYTPVDTQVEVLITLDGVEYKMLVLSPAAAMCWHVTVLPSNTVLVPRITGESVAQAIVKIVERGLGDPRTDNGWDGALQHLLGEDYDEILPDWKSRPTLEELSAALELAGVEEPRIEACHLLSLWRLTRFPEIENHQEVGRLFESLYERHQVLAGPSDRRH